MSVSAPKGKALMSAGSVSEEETLFQRPSQPSAGGSSSTSSSKPRTHSRFVNGLTPELEYQRRYNRDSGSTESTIAKISRPIAASAGARRQERPNSYTNPVGYPQFRQNDARSVEPQASLRHASEQSQGNDRLIRTSQSPSQNPRFGRHNNRPVRTNQNRNGQYELEAHDGQSNAAMSTRQPSRFDTLPAASSSRSELPARRQMYQQERAASRPVRPKRRIVKSSAGSSARRLSPMPESVLNQHGHYKNASHYPMKAFASTAAAEMRPHMNDIKKVHLDNGILSKIARGDWQTFVAPVFKSIDTKKEGTLKTSGMTFEVRQNLLEKARIAMVGNSSIKLNGKVELMQTLEHAV